MKDKAFIDSDIILYLYSKSEIEKRKKCETLFENSDVIISIQVINEVANILYKKLKLDWDDIKSAILELFEKFSVQTIHSSTIQEACDIALKYKYSYYDSLILATALENQCNIIYIEDMHHNQLIENKLNIQNPLLKKDE